MFRVRQFQGDLIAGIAVGLTVVPQSLAYAKIAELPPQVYSVQLQFYFGGGFVPDPSR